MKVIPLLIALAWTTTAAGQTIVDGDTLKLGGITYRLWGIDAPELQQDCPDGWPAGKKAAEAMQSLVENSSVTCEERTRDRYGRAVAVCRAGGEDVGAILVREGLAWAFTRYSTDYVLQQRLARSEGLGVHGHGCEPAWDWRQRKRRAAQPTP